MIKEENYMLVTLKEYAKINDLTYTAVRHAVADGRLKPECKHGQSWMIDDKTQWLSSHSKHRHGLSNTRIYRIWQGMKKRCYNPRSVHYKDYGGRGITVCDEWKQSAEAFYKWAIANGYEDNLSIDRIDNDGNYEPSNCRWATSKQQANNMRDGSITRNRNRKINILKEAIEFVPEKKEEYLKAIRELEEEARH